jgi:hypothetical protein
MPDTRYSSNPVRQQIGLVEAALPFALAVQRNRQNQVPSPSGEPPQRLAETISQLTGEGAEAAILEMLQNIAEPAVVRCEAPSDVECEHPTTAVSAKRSAMQRRCASEEHPALGALNSLIGTHSLPAAIADGNAN